MKFGLFSKLIIFMKLKEGSLVFKSDSFWVDYRRKLSTILLYKATYVFLRAIFFAVK